MALTQAEAQAIEQQWNATVQPAIDAVKASLAAVASGHSVGTGTVAQQALTLVKAVVTAGLMLDYTAAN